MRERENFHLLVYYANTLNGWGLAGFKPVASYTTQASTTLSHHPLPSTEHIRSNLESRAWQRIKPRYEYLIIYVKCFLLPVFIYIWQAETERPFVK